MTDSEKLEFVLSEISTVYHLNNEYIDFIKENVLLRSEYYKNFKINFDNETIYINNSSSSMDFFLNRLIHNIRGFEYNNVYNPNNNETEEYNSDTQVLKLSSQRTIGDIVVKKLQNRNIELSEEETKKLYRKIISHEFGHAFQTQFSGDLGHNDIKYNDLLTNLFNKHPEIITLPNYGEPLKVIQNGLIPALIDDGKNSMREYYSNKDRIILIDDIFNEDEALEIFKMDRIQGKYDLGQDCYKNIFNYESNNFKITPYARMMKLILGSNKTFRSLYKNGLEFYEFFDQFETLATQIFKNGVQSKKPVVSCMLDALERIKRDNSIRDVLNMDLFLTKCLQKRIKFYLNQNMTKDDLINIKKIVNEFIIRLTKCKSGRLDHDYVIDEIKSLIDNY